MATMEEYAKQPLDQRLQRLERTADELAGAIRGQSGGVLTQRPGAKDWAGVEIICHLRDAEETFDGRFQMFLSMENVTLLPVDVDRVATDRQYLRCDAGEAIEAFRTRRSEKYRWADFPASRFSHWDWPAGRAGRTRAATRRLSARCWSTTCSLHGSSLICSGWGISVVCCYGRALRCMP